MNASKPIFFLLFFIINAGAYAQQEEEEWKLIKQESWVKVYSRPASDGSSRKELKVITDVNYSLSAIVSLFADKPSYPKWVYGCASAEILKNISDWEMYHYQTTSMPWPIQNRDLVIHTTVSQDPETRIVKVIAKALPDYIPVKEDYVRVLSYNSLWTFTPKPNGIVELEYIIAVDPGGNIPNVLVNMAIADGPVNTIKNLRDFLPHYQNAKLAYIKE
jgi:hypothetical protein